MDLEREAESGDVDVQAAGGSHQRASVITEQTEAVGLLLSEKDVVQLTEVDGHLLQRFHGHRVIQLSDNQRTHSWCCYCCCCCYYYYYYYYS